MIEKYGLVIARALATMARMEGYAEELAKPPTALRPGLVAGGDDSFRGVNIDWMKHATGVIRTCFGDLGFLDFEPALGRIELPLQFGRLAAATSLPADVKALKDRFQDRLATEWFYHVEPADRPLYGQKELFGDQVARKFPKSLEDIEAAGSCLALGQGTACVFHLMRAMEAAVGRLCTRLNIPNPDREWGKLLSDINKAVEAMPKGTAKEQRKRNAWSEAHTHLYHLKQAWRNDTMHPKKTYTQEQAREVFAATRVFMNYLAGLV